MISDFEFPTIGQIWHAQELRGAEVVARARRRRGDPGRAVRRGDRRAHGGRLDRRGLLPERLAAAVEEIARIAHERGALVVLDAYQAIGTYPLDVRELGVDVLAAGVLKYLLGSAGPRLHVDAAGPRRASCCRRRPAGSPTATSSRWTSRDYAPSPTARRFQSGTPPVPNIYAGIAGMELMMEIGIAETREHVSALNERLIAGVDELGGTVVTPRDAGAARRARLHPLDRRPGSSSRRSRSEGIVTSERDGNLRVSAHAYNTADDIDRVLAPLPPPSCWHDWRPTSRIRRGCDLHSADLTFYKTRLRCFFVKSDMRGPRRSQKRSSCSRPTTARARSPAARR